MMLIDAVTRFPSPGSAVARLEFDCLCPGEENMHGEGNEYMSGRDLGRRWVYHVECPFHQAANEGAHYELEDHPEWAVLAPL